MLTSIVISTKLLKLNLDVLTIKVALITLIEFGSYMHMYILRISV